MQVSIIIVNYNTAELLLACIHSVYEHTKDVNYEIIVVDNASKDQSVAMLKKSFPDVKLIKSPVNLGFGGANNQGVEEAVGKYLFFLNSDTLLQNNSVRCFYEYMEAHSEESIGAIGGWLLDEERNPNLSYGVFPTLCTELNYLPSKSMKSKPNRNNSAENDDFFEVDYVIGADLFMRKDLFMALGGFDVNFFMYYEETDLQKRMKDLGLKRGLIDSPKIIHLEGGSFSNKGLTYSRFKMAQASFKYYLKKHYGGAHRYFFRLGLEGCRLLRFGIIGLIQKTRF